MVKIGALHKQLGLPQRQPISTTVLRKIIGRRKGGKVLGKTVTPLMKKRARFAMSFR